jgi:predicted NACHT family NTPase
VRGYRPEGVRQYEEIKKPILRDVFVPLGLMDIGQSGGYRRGDRNDELAIAQMENKLDIWKLLKRAENDPAFTKIAVLAWGGSGKTTLLKHVAYTFGREEHKKYDVKSRIPFLLHLRNYRQAIAEGKLAALPEVIHSLHIPKLPSGAEIRQSLKWVSDVLLSGKAIVMLDGFDEVASEQRSAVAKWMNDQMKAYGKSVFIITSRPRAYREQAPAHQMDVTMPIWVRDFNADQRRQFIEQWYRCQERMAAGEKVETDVTKREALQATDALTEQINDRPELQALAKNPLLLNMIVTFHRRRPWGTLPTLRSDLYREICQLQLVDRPESRGVETVLPGVDALLILQRLALEMMQRQIQRISQEDLLPLITEYLKDEDESIGAEKFIDDVVSISELLVDQVEDYDFAHLSFQEYLAALEIARLRQEEILYPKLEDDRWKAVILYYAGLVRNPISLIRELQRVKRIDLADQCLKEVRRISPAISDALELLKTEVKDDRYSKLRLLLNSEQWREADRETTQLMFKVAGKEDQGYLEPEDIETFSCEDLLTIDNLWVEASNGHFGFSVQKKIWEKCGSPMDYNDDYEKFMEAVGWRSGDTFGYSNLKFSQTLSLIGELPFLILVFNEGGYPFLVQRLVNCSTGGIENEEC